MSNRFPASISAALAVIALASAPAVAQTKTTAPLPAKEGAKTWTPPKTADGVPDISGIFTNSVVTPLERPKDLGTKEFFTAEEADALGEEECEPGGSEGPGTYGDVHYSMAQFGLEKKSVEGCRERAEFPDRRARRPRAAAAARKRRSGRLSARR